MAGESHVCGGDRAWRSPPQPSKGHYAAVFLLFVAVTAGTFPLMRQSRSIVFFIPLVVLLWFGLPAIVSRLVPRNATVCAAIANLCTVVSAAVWPSPGDPNKLTDPVFLLGFAAAAVVAVSFSTIVSNPIQRRHRNLAAAPRRSVE